MRNDAETIKMVQFLAFFIMLIIGGVAILKSSEPLWKKMVVWMALLFFFGELCKYI